MANFSIDDVIEEGPKVEPQFQGDAFQVALDSGWIREFSPGQLVYTEQMTSFLRALENVFRAEIVVRLGYKEWTLPRLLPSEVLEKFGSVKYAPRTLFEVSQFYENPKRRRRFFLDTVQSASLYFILATSPIDDDTLPLKVFEARGGGQYRNERDVEGMRRLVEYHKLEFVYVGFPLQVTEARKIQMDTYKDLFEKLGMRYRIVVGAPCHESPENSIRYKEAKNLDEVPLFDFEFLIPHDKSWLEVCGTCVEADENTKSYGIESQSGKHLWSGCSGVGLDRLAFAFLSQHGFDMKNYPELLKDHSSGYILERLPPFTF